MLDHISGGRLNFGIAASGLPSDWAMFNVDGMSGANRDMTREDYVRVFGSEGAELITWLVMRGCMNDVVTTLHRHYFAPASMTGAGMVLLENA